MPNLKRSPEQSLGRTGLTSRLQVSYLAPDKLKPDPANPRKHDRAQLKRLAKSIETFGFLVPAIVNANNEIVCGHARVLVAAKCNLTEIPVIRVDHLTDAQLRAFMIAENRLNELSSWDDQLLAEQLRLLDSLKLDFEIEATGFDLPEIDLRIESINSTNKAEPDPADSLPEVLCHDPVSKLHDVWQLGRDAKYRLGRVRQQVHGSSNSNAEIDVGALKKNKYRLVALYNRDTGRLVIGTDISALTGKGSQQLSANADQFFNESKLAVRANPRRLIAEGLSYPDANVRKFVAGLRDFEKYSVFRLSFEPRPGRYFAAKAELGND